MKPMLATLIKEPFDDKDWVFEIKWDGYRALAEKNKKVKLLSRNNKAFNARFPHIVEELEKIPGRFVLDGEIVILDEKKKSRFQLLQNVAKKEHKAYYYLFDILSFENKDLRPLPLIKRKAFLKILLNQQRFKYLRISPHASTYGKKFFEKAKHSGQEGIIAKRKESPYLSTRSREWLKIKAKKGQEFVIAGFTPPRGSRKYFGALVLAIYKGGKLTFAGHVGTGFDQKQLKFLYEKMAPLRRKTSPLKESPLLSSSIIWIQPKLVCEIAFAEWTDEGILRQPVFKGLRIDKTAKSVVRE